MSNGSQIPPRCGGHSERRSASAVGAEERQLTVMTTVRQANGDLGRALGRQSLGGITPFLPAGSATAEIGRAIVARRHLERCRPG